MTHRRRWTALIAFWLTIPGSLWALSPISYRYDLVAGGEDHGYRDGGFSQALFDHPSGLAVSPDGTQLYVCDWGNNRIRVVLLDHQDQVKTLAGDGRSQSTDGSLLQASFDHPVLAAALDGNRLLVYDGKSSKLRLLDLGKDRVETLGPPEGWPSLGALVTDPTGKEVLVTSPDLHQVLLLDPTTGKAVTIAENRPELPNPLALAVEKVPGTGGTPAASRLILGDKYSGAVCEADWDGNTLVGSFHPLGKGAQILSLVAAGDRSYAFQAQGPPWLRLRPGLEEVKLQSMGGAEIDNQSGPNLLFLLYMSAGPPAPASVAAPGQDRCVFVSVPETSSILRLRDYAYVENRKVREAKGDHPNPDLDDDRYPERKPPHTFRILLLGDSRSCWGMEADYGKRWPWGFNLQDSFPKKLEEDLNLMGALEDAPESFQVLTLSRLRADGPPFLWPDFWAVQQPGKYDVDLVLMMVDSDMGLLPYLQNRILKTGFPDILNPDPEFRLRPLEKRMTANPDLKVLFQSAKKRGLLVLNNDEWINGNFDRLVEDPTAKDILKRLVGLPIQKYKGDLAANPPQGRKAPPLVVCYFPLGNLGNHFPVEGCRSFWGEVSRDQGLPFLDLTEAWNAVRVMGYPVAEQATFSHFSPEGHRLMGWVLAHGLIKGKYVPWGAGAGEGVQVIRTP